MTDLLDKETVTTETGDYTISWYQDECPERPYHEGFHLVYNGEHWSYLHRWNNIEEGDDLALGGIVKQALSNSYHQWDHVSGAALVRYLRLNGKRGVTLIDADLRPVEPSTDRSVRVHGVAWAPDDAHDPDKYTLNELYRWRSWSNGNCFGFIVDRANGIEVEAVWGFYGFSREQDYTRTLAMEAIEYDVQHRINAANLAGAGFIGIV